MGFTISKKTYIVTNLFLLMPKITFEKIINADAQKTFDVLTNFENFENILPEFYSSITVKSTRDESSLVVEHLHLCGNEFVIMAKHFTEKPNQHQMRVIGGDIKGSYITESIIPLTDSNSLNTQTKLIINAEIKTSRGLKGTFKKLDYNSELEKLYQKFADVIGD